MSTDSKDGFKPNSTHGEFWGGYMLDWMPYWILVVFGGLFGLDKLALRSPTTAFLKFIVNLLFFGAWWVYDILQLADRTFVAKYGHTTPFGVSGHGYRLIHGLTKEKTDEYTTASTYNNGIVTTLGFIAYVISAVFLGFTGLPNLIAGDGVGAAIKLASNFFFGIPTLFYLLAPIVYFWGMGSLGKDNIPHEPPLYSWFTIYKDYPAYNLISKEAGMEKTALFETTYDLSGGKPKNPDVQPDLIRIPKSLFAMAYDAAGNFPMFAPFLLAREAKEGVKAISEVSASAAQVGKTLTKELEKEITANPKAFIQGLLPPVSATPVANPMLQKGGAFLGVSPEFDTILLISMGVLIVGGFAAALLRKFSPPKREEEDEYPRNAYDRDDAPPNPGGV
jgi:hypothetical protein